VFSSSFVGAFIFGDDLFFFCRMIPKLPMLASSCESRAVLL
jgi:hypothetical protein